MSEEIAIHYGNDFKMATRVARFHNIYGPQVRRSPPFVLGSLSSTLA